MNYIPQGSALEIACVTATIKVPVYTQVWTATFPHRKTVMQCVMAARTRNTGLKKGAGLWPVHTTGGSVFFLLLPALFPTPQSPKQPTV